MPLTFWCYVNLVSFLPRCSFFEVCSSFELCSLSAHANQWFGVEIANVVVSGWKCRTNILVHLVRLEDVETIYLTLVDSANVQSALLILSALTYLSRVSSFAASCHSRRRTFILLKVNFELPGIECDLPPTCFFVLICVNVTFTYRGLYLSQLLRLPHPFISFAFSSTFH